ncbi:MAG: 16S rRNA (cytidine(1402)-2'-O)-methyltransferase [Actinobacteria bacterium]|nr:16S rRNA (cytidine(1402)-2'-O)-methyltransferase [Actinomycetota bacterium]
MTVGTLLLVATPIGNLGDLSPRAIEALQGCALICCEDTRRTGGLLSHFGIHGVRMAIANEHTETARVDEVLNLLAAGQTVAVVTDAGMPGISDPGERLVRAAIEHHHTVSAVPGPSAEVMALVISGLPSHRYVFEGFLPRSGTERAQRLREATAERRTVVLYEAPHRLARTLAELHSICGPDRRVVLARELTKLHEEVWRGTLGEAVARVAEREPQGEYVIVLDGAELPPGATDDDIRAALDTSLGAGASRKSAVASVAQLLDVPKNRVYDIALSIGAQLRGNSAS